MAEIRQWAQGLLSDEERKNSWTLSERAGQVTPDGMQRLLSTTDWDPDAVRDALIGYVNHHLGDPEGILVINETGFVKKGAASAGVARQYSGTAGRVENCQIGVFVTYATTHGRTLVDRELYIPKAWTQDPDRCTRAGILAHRHTLATKPALAADMIERVLDAGVPAQWVTGDTVYGAHHGLRDRLEARRMQYMLAVPKNHTVILPITDAGGPARVDEVIAALDARAWRTRTAGAGTKGDRRYAWARQRLHGPTDDGEHWLLARRSLQDPTDLASYVCYTPANTNLITMARVVDVSGLTGVPTRQRG